jgi:hypothetical protein
MVVTVVSMFAALVATGESVVADGSVTGGSVAGGDVSGATVSGAVLSAGAIDVELGRSEALLPEHPAATTETVAATTHARTPLDRYAADQPSNLMTSGQEVSPGMPAASRQSSQCRFRPDRVANRAQIGQRFCPPRCLGPR